MIYKNIITAILILIIILIIFQRLVLPHIYITQINVNSRQWNVSRNYENKQEAARILDRLHAKVLKFLRHLKRKYYIDDPAAPDAKFPGDTREMADFLLNNYNPEVFYENDPQISRDTSYTLDKGRAMYLCIRDRKNPTKFIHDDILLFVMLHEVAHIANYKGWGHDRHYWEVFKWILHEARESGIYYPADYDRYPVDFCGLRVYYQPLNDNNLRSIWV